MAMSDDGAAWSEEFAALLARLGPRFGRVEPRRRAAAYLQGAAGAGGAQERLAAGGGGRGPDAGRGAGVSEPGALGRGRGPRRSAGLCGRASGRSLAAVLVLDETGFLKKGAQVGGGAAAV